MRYTRHEAHTARGPAAGCMNGPPCERTHLLSRSNDDFRGVGGGGLLWGCGQGGAVDEGHAGGAAKLGLSLAASCADARHGKSSPRVLAASRQAPAAGAAEGGGRR